MTRLSVIVLCCALYSVQVVRAQSSMAGQRTPNRPDVRLQHIAEPPELAGEPGPIPAPPTPASLQFVQSKAISAANPHDVKTLPPAIRELTERSVDGIGPRGHRPAALAGFNPYIPSDRGALVALVDFDDLTAARQGLEHSRGTQQVTVTLVGVEGLTGGIKRETLRPVTPVSP